MIGAIVASSLVGLVALRTRRSFAWDDPMSALMLASAALMVAMCGSLLIDGQWRGALFMAPLAGAVVVPAVLLGRVPKAPPARRKDEDDDEDDAGGGGGGGRPPAEPPPGPPEPGLDWDRFDEVREAWRRAGTRSGV